MAPSYFNGYCAAPGVETLRASHGLYKLTGSPLAGGVNAVTFASLAALTSTGLT